MLRSESGRVHFIPLSMHFRIPLIRMRKSMPRFSLHAACLAVAATFAATAEGAPSPCAGPYASGGVSVEVLADAVTPIDFPGPTVCAVSATLDAAPDPAAVNAQRFFGGEDWTLVGAYDFASGIVTGDGLTVSGTGQGGDYDIAPYLYGHHDAAFLLMTSGEGIVPGAVAFSLPVLNFMGSYLSPWRTTDPSSGAVGTPGIGRISLFMAGAVAPGVEVPLPAALPLSLLGLAALAAVSRGARRRGGKSRDSALDAPEAAG